MNKEELDLKTILSSAREIKGYSQRKVARNIGIHHSTLNDIENGNIKKVDIEVLRKLAETLDLSLELLLRAAGYSEFVYMLREKDNTKSTRDLKNLLDEYRNSQMDMLDDMYQKRMNVRDCRTRLHSLIMILDNYDTYKYLWTTEKINEELKEIFDELAKSAEKYDYKKLPKE